MGAIEPPPASVNDRYFEQLARKDWLRNLQTAYFEQRVALKHARIKSHFVRYFDMTSKNVHFVEHLARQLRAGGVRREPRRPSSSSGSTPRWPRSTRRPSASRASCRPRA